VSSPKIQIRPGIVEHRFVDAGEFLRALDASGNIWANETDVWIFRGHADASWPLEPNAHRGERWAALAPPGEAPFVPSTATEGQRLTKEHRVLQAFLEALDGAAVPVPIEYRMAGGTSGINLKVAALAQHYGLPTRLLDWTRQSHVAAYFACLRPNSTAPDLAVWALNASFVNSNPTEKAFCEVIRTTRADNPNLHAQDGLFTIAGAARGTDLNSTALLTIEGILSDVAAGLLPLRDGAPPIPDPIMRKFVLPRDQEQALMRRLHQRRISASRIFPGLAGVAMSVRERLQFDVKDVEF
jgi:hypothetical protein